MNYTNELLGVVKEVESLGSSRKAILDRIVPLLKNRKSPSSTDRLEFPIKTGLRINPKDIVRIKDHRVVQVLYCDGSLENVLFLTNNCNQKCIMCSQPPSNRDDIEYSREVTNKLIDLIPSDIDSIGITGGEPTLQGIYLGKIINSVHAKSPNAKVNVLTNGILLANRDFFVNFEGVDKEKVIFSVPLYSDYYEIHDSITGVPGGFTKTIKGIYNLFAYGFPVEIRIIPQKLNISRFDKFGEFVYRNLTFVDHIAIMGLEVIGNCSKHIDSIWINPSQFNTAVSPLINYLDMVGMSVSIFNMPLCVLLPKLRRFSVQSITDWKVRYYQLCERCLVKEECGGVFFSSKNYLADFIEPIEDQDHNNSDVNFGK